MWRLEYDDSALIANLSALEKQQLPFATMLALNDSMYDVVQAWHDALPRLFDRPTPFTLNAVLYKKATKQNLVAEVYLRDEISDSTPPARYLYPEVVGGARAAKPFEYLMRAAGILASDEFMVPAKGFPLDQYGNVPGTIVRTILADVQAINDTKDRSTAASRAKRAGRKAVSKRAVYFYSPGPSGDRGDGRPQHLPRGIYERVGFGLGSSIRMVFLIVKGAPRYTLRFNAEALAQAAFSKSFPDRFRTRLSQALATARIR